MTAEALPGVSLTFAGREPAEEPLRTDVAVFAGRTRRGPVLTPVRVESRNDVVASFGAPDAGSATPDALRGFFENGGRTAWVVRVAGPGDPASALWTVGDIAGFAHRQYRVTATSPGAWANGGRVRIRFRASTVAGPPTVTVRIDVPGEPPETFTGQPPEVTGLVGASRLIGLVPDGPEPSGAPGPLSMTWDLGLTGGTDVAPGRAEYAAAVAVQADLPEPALVALPDLGADLGGGAHTDTVRDLLAAAAASLDRLVVLDVPPGVSAVDEVLSWVDGLAGDPALLGNAAVYHPALRLPEGRTVPASGHVLGVVARLDAERGAHHTPANAVLLDAVDLATEYPEPQQVRLFDAGVDLLRCTRGRGLVVWGGRTLTPDHRYVAHRRLLHLLVRATRRVATPLVFDVASAELRLTLVRSLTSVLLAAFRAGALAGARPEQAFQVVCDDTLNPPGQDPALVVCEIGVAPAVPMEFVRLRLVLGQDRSLEVIEA
ncbi:phage tail sheath subtilisin-like domain-containing protein [Amycolatopsis sp. NPDC051102]|uniref:phage tail sheath subtilisin-like domain-containing protein n=1 Tax=Amycolatopsis sp. NPDC051102 TaxID=3155163 RepID=UPI003424F490